MHVEVYDQGFSHFCLQQRRDNIALTIFQLTIRMILAGLSAVIAAFIEFGNIPNPTVAIVPVLIKLLLDTFSMSEFFKLNLM